MPTVEQAKNKLQSAVFEAKHRGDKVLRVIHGYGSTGVGGRLRPELRKMLSEMQAGGQIKGYVPGERWVRTDPAARRILDTFPYLKNDPDLGRGNEGITVVWV